MRFPVLLCKRDALVVVRRDFFERVGRLDEDSGQLDLNVARDGRAGSRWILDREGALYGLISKGVAPASWWQTLGLRRRRERFKIEPAVAITATQLAHLISGLQDISADLPNVSDLQRVLAGLPSGQVLTAESLSGYFGEVGREVAGHR